MNICGHHRILIFSFRSYVIFILMLFLVVLDIGNKVWSADPDSAFVVYDGLLYLNKPDLTQYGIEEIKFMYTSALWPSGASRDEPDEEYIKKASKSLTSKMLVCVDIEHWPYDSRKVGNDEVQKTILKLQNVSKWIHESVPGLRMGYYMVMPIRDYWTPVKEDQTKMAAWIAANSQLIALAPSVDAVFPSLYTFYEDQEGWRKYAVANIAEAKKFAKPVYVVLWPEFHDSTSLKGQNIPADYWRMQLDVCREYADGIVIWGGWQKEWDENAQWWVETKSFLGSWSQPSSVRKLHIKDVKSAR